MLSRYPLGSILLMPSICAKSLTQSFLRCHLIRWRRRRRSYSTMWLGNSRRQLWSEDICSGWKAVVVWVVFTVELRSCKVEEPRVSKCTVHVSCAAGTWLIKSRPTSKSHTTEVIMCICTTMVCPSYRIVIAIFQTSSTILPDYPVWCTASVCWKM